VELARDSSRVDGGSAAAAHHICNIVSEALAHLPQYLCDFPVSDEPITDCFVACHLELEPLTDLFERMTEWPVTKVHARARPRARIAPSNSRPSICGSLSSGASQCG